MRISKKRIRRSFVLQRDSTDCGPACLLNLIRYYDGDHSLQDLRERSGTGKDGTTLLGLQQAATKAGFDARGYEAGIEDIIRHGIPLILHILSDTQTQHYVICYGFQQGKFLIGDPARGVVEYTRENLDRAWVSRKCLTVVPNGAFRSGDSVRRRRKAWILRLAKEDYPVLSATVFLGVLVSVLGVAMSVFSQKLIDELLPSGNESKLLVGIIIVAILLVTRVVLSAVRNLILLRQGRGFNNRIIKAFYSTLLSQPKSFYDNKRVGDLVARLNDTGRIQRAIASIAGGIIIDGLTIFASLALIFYYSWQAAVIACVSLPAYYFLVYSFNDRIINLQRSVMGSYSLSESNFINTMLGIATIKNLNKQPLFIALNQAIYGTFQERILQLGKVNVRLGVLSGLFGVAFTTATIVYMSYQVIDGRMTVGEMIAILAMMGILINAVSSFAVIPIPLNEARVAFDRMYEFVNKEQEPERGSGVDLVSFERMDVRNITFRFPGRKSILEDVSFSVCKGEFAGLVGESGTGKSTLVQILQKFYAPETGQILINDATEICEISDSDWNRIIGVVPQEISIFNGTVLYNIGFPDSEAQAAQTIEFCKSIGLDGAISALPQGYYTLVGEEGINLSGGQRQLVALARALHHRPQLLILDEATSAMDRHLEKLVLDVLSQMQNSIAVIWISHRLHLLKSIASRIYVMEGGRIVGSGRHDDLMAGTNFYSLFWKEISRH